MAAAGRSAGCVVKVAGQGFGAGVVLVFLCSRHIIEPTFLRVGRTKNKSRRCD